MCNRTDPVSSAEVHSLSKVVTLVKSGVIGTRKCHNKLASTLISSVHLNTNKNTKSKVGEEKKNH